MLHLNYSMVGINNFIATWGIELREINLDLIVESRCIDAILKKT